MRQRRTGMTAWCAAVFLFLAITSARAEPHGTLILRGGAVYTLDPARPWATALVVRDGRIVHVGDDAGTRRFQHRGTDVIALKGRMVLPGFHDGHAHPMSGAIRLIRCRLNDAATPDALFAAVRACTANSQNAWLVGYGIAQTFFDKGALSRAKLDALVPDRPAFLTTEDGFAAWVNTKALALSGVDPQSQKIDGVLKDDATDLVRSHVPKPSEAEYRRALKQATAMANAFGITSIFDASASAAMVQAYHDADLAHELTVRIVAAQRMDPGRGPEQIDAMIALRDRVQSPYLRADAAKFFLDGEIDQHTAALLAPYTDVPASRGELFLQTDVLNTLVRKLDASGFSVHMHVMGDWAVRAGLDAIEAATQANGPRDRRHQLAHVGVADPADIARFCKLGVAANFQPLFAAESEPSVAADRAVLGPQRARWMYPLSAIAACGARIVASSDWPQPTMNPLEEIESALTRPTPEPGQHVDLAMMLAAYTQNAAWAAREDSIDGTLEVGKSADVIVLDRNLFKTKISAIHKARVVLTLLDGVAVYRAPNL